MTSTTPTSSEKQTGTVVKWLNHRGIGFITPDGQDTVIGNDLLVHYSHIKQDTAQDGFKSLSEGSRVEFDTTQDPKHPDKLIAINVTSIGGGDCEPRPRKSQKSLYDEDSIDDTLLFVYADWENTTKKTTWRDLKEHFSLQHSDAYVKRADLVPSKGYGIVKFATAEDAQTAMQKLDGSEFHGQTIQVKATKPNKEDE
jgi:CspA family cold shock protein